MILNQRRYPKKTKKRMQLLIVDTGLLIVSLSKRTQGMYMSEGSVHCSGRIKYTVRRK